MHNAPADSAPGAADVDSSRPPLAHVRALAGHRRVQAGLTLLAVLALWKVAHAGLSGWAVGLGMDEQRGALVAALLAVLGLAGAATLAGARPGPARLGALAGFTAIEVVPFLVSAARTGSTGGLETNVAALGWVAQPLGMLLMAWLATTAGAAMGSLVRADLAGLVVRLRRSRRTAPAVLLALTGAMVLAVPAATTALQDGSLTALYSYAVPAGPGGNLAPATGHDGHSRSGVVAVVKGGAHIPTGHIQVISVNRRDVRVYLPAAYTLEPSSSFATLYFLHGYPSTEMQWMSGAQLPGVLDQLIAARVIPPLIAVLPNGNGDATADAEWGDTNRGDRVEDWLVDEVVPAVDARYRTLGGQRRGVAGLSAGGFGAVNIAVHHPEIFDWAASYSGYFTARRDLFKGPAAAANSPLLSVARLGAVDRMPLYVGVGTGDGHFLEANETFGTELRRLGWEPVSFDVVPGGHGWAAWRLELVHSLEWLGTLWPPPTEHLVPGAPVE